MKIYLITMIITGLILVLWAFSINHVTLYYSLAKLLQDLRLTPDQTDLFQVSIKDILIRYHFAGWIGAFISISSFIALRIHSRKSNFTRLVTS